LIAYEVVAALALAYCLGSIPFGLIIGRYWAKTDIRQYGSGKTGATNVLRTMGKKAAAIAAALDVSKGALAVVFAGMIVGRGSLGAGGPHLDGTSIKVLAGLAAIAGHVWPIFYRFRGGRGVATFFGGLLVISPPVALLGGEALIIVAALTRFASLGSIVAVVVSYTAMAVLYVFSGFPLAYTLYVMFGAIAIIFLHRDNISRLLAGTERRLGERS
jgi:glycerol-3-phosphate acyltransferase PlsY